MKLLFTLALAASAASASAQEPTPGLPPGTITAEVPIVAGNAASAKQRAMDDAFRQAVERAFGALVAEAGIGPSDPMPPGLAQLRAGLFSRGKRYIRSYRVLEQGEQAGRYRVQIDAEVDEGILRRDIDKARGATAVSPTRAPPSSAVLVAGTPPEAVSALTRALGTAGLRADAPPLGAVDEARARQVAARSNAAAAVLVSGSVAAEGPVRGAGKIAARCQLAVRILPTGGTQPSDRATESRAFAEGEETARTDCLARAAGELARQIATTVAPTGTAVPGLRTVTLDLDLVEPAALPLVLQALRKVGSVSSTEVRRVTVGHVEVRAATRLAAPALASALARELGSSATAVPGNAVADRVSVQVRLAAIAPQVPLNP